MYRPARVYVAGPFSGDQMANINDAVSAADYVLDAGGVPFLPHTMTGFWHLISPKPYESWMNFDLVWLGCCDLLYVFGQITNGVQIEIEEAERLGIPVVYNKVELVSYINSHRRDE